MPIIVSVCPGTAYILLSIFLACRHLWAVVATLVLALANLFIFVVIGGSAVANGEIPCFLAIILGMAILTLVLLIYHLTKSFEAIKYVPLDEQRGFEVLMPPPTNEPPPGQNKR